MEKEEKNDVQKQNVGNAGEYYIAEGYQPSTLL